MTRRLLRPLFTAALLIAGCTDDMPAGPMPPAASGLPCDVDQALAARCRSCHGAELKNGAPMPLLTWSDVMAPAPSDPSRTVADRMVERIEADEMPPVRSPDLEQAERDALLGWLAAGAPRDDTMCGQGDAGPTPGTDAGTPPPLTCDGETFRFLAHAEGDEAAPYHVPVGVGDGNYYMCFAFPAPFAAGALAASFDSEIDDDRVVHHLILYSAAERPVADVFPCSEMPGNVTFVSGWAPGAGPIVMPDGVGAELPPPGAWLILQVHYWNVAGHADAFDRSGLTACVPDEPAPEVAAVFKLGNQAFRIPPRSVGHAITGDCQVPDIGSARRVLGTAPHMHMLGRSIETLLLRDGEEDRVETLVHVEPWDFNTQGFFPLDEVVMVDPGDVLRTTCVYDNPGDDEVRTGEDTESEMCLNFLYVVPATPPSMRSCIQSHAGE